MTAMLHKFFSNLWPIDLRVEEKRWCLIFSKKLFEMEFIFFFLRDYMWQHNICLKLKIIGKDFGNLFIKKKQRGGGGKIN